MPTRYCLRWPASLYVLRRRRSWAGMQYVIGSSATVSMGRHHRSSDQQCLLTSIGTIPRTLWRWDRRDRYCSLSILCHTQQSGLLDDRRMAHATGRFSLADWPSHLVYHRHLRHAQHAKVALVSHQAETNVSQHSIQIRVKTRTEREILLGNLSRAFA